MEGELGRGQKASLLVSQGPVTYPMNCSCADSLLIPCGSWAPGQGVEFLRVLRVGVIPSDSHATSRTSETLAYDSVLLGVHVLTLGPVVRNCAYRHRPTIGPVLEN